MKIRELQTGATVNLIENGQTVQVTITYSYFNHFVSYERIGYPEDQMHGSMLYGAFLKNGRLA